MATVLDFITNQFKKSGVELTAEMKEALNNPELTKINLNDDLVKQHNDRLMTVEVAKQNPALKQHFRFETLAPLDGEIEKMITEYEIPDEYGAPIKAEKSTYEKVKLLSASIKQLQEKKATAQVGDKKALIEQIDKLNGDLVALRTNAKNREEQLIRESKDKELDWNIGGSLASYNYSKNYGERLDAIALAKIKLNRRLQSDGAKVVLGTDGFPKLVQASDTSLDFTRENQKVNYKDYIDKMVADEKMIEVTDSKPTPPTGQAPPPTNGTGGNKDILPTAMNDIQKELENALRTTN